MPAAPIQMGQVYAGALSRFCFPPDSSDWWNIAGSYEIAIAAVESHWIAYQSYRVFSDGRRECIQSTTEFRKARLADFQKDLDEGILTLISPAREQPVDHE